MRSYQRSSTARVLPWIVLGLVSFACAAQAEQSTAQACVPTDSIDKLLAEANHDFQAADYASTLQKLDAVDAFTPKQPCEQYLADSLRAQSLYQLKDYLAALDVIDSILNSGNAPPDDVETWKLSKAKAKALAKNEGLAKDRETKKRLKLTAEEREALTWESFQAGKYMFPVESGFAGALLGSLGVRFDSISSIETAEAHLRSQQWEELARYVIRYRESKGLDIDYFYLAAAAYGLGLDGPTRIYATASAKLANEHGRRDCSSPAETDGYRSVDYCGGHHLPAEANDLIAAIDRRQIERARLEAEEVRRREEEAQQAAAAVLAAAENKRKAEENKRKAEAAAAARAAYKRELAAKFPAEWVDDILAGKVRKGMSKEAVKESLGNPVKVERIDTQEMWLYGSRRIVFSGDQVTFVDQ